MVGVAACAPIGDYPDPMTYRLDNFMPWAFVSVADICTVWQQGGELTVPGTGQKITNAVPVFDDPRVQRFLIKYAPSALEYICSLGMRRVIAEVPRTYPYTVCAGIIKLLEQLDLSKSELNVRLLMRMVPCYHEVTREGYSYLQPHLRRVQDKEMSFFLNHNGTTNMIAPIYEFLTTAEKGVVQHNMPRILRALYTYEAYQYVRRRCKHQGEGFATEQLDALLGVDASSRGTPLPPMFERDEPRHCSEVVVEPALLEEMQRGFEHVKYITTIQRLLEAIRAEDPVQDAAGIPPITKETARVALGLEYEMEEFLLYNIVEGFLFPNKQSRLDKETNRPLRPDLGLRAAGMQMCAQYVEGRYQADYDRRLRQQAGEEKAIIVQDLVRQLANAPDMSTFRMLLVSGVARGVVSHTIANVNSLGCKELEESLLNIQTDVPHRARKLVVYYTGRGTGGRVVWNGGNVIRAPPAVPELLMEIGEEAMWNHIEEALKRALHRYRTSDCNRHGHSNETPSYWAHGHSSLCSFAMACDAATWDEYKKDHVICCGMAQFLATKDACALLGKGQHTPPTRD